MSPHYEAGFYLALYIDDDGHLVYGHNAFTKHTIIRSEAPLPAGDLTIGLHRAHFAAAGDQGTVRVSFSLRATIA